ncbi:MAG: hypothetical protein CM15mP32_3380 [Flavobacteriaceae bacterium]|nr:MAG: hypothetical protein CM15mP32_3380 [Flavobacteriaceae bacterium]
MLDPLKPLTKRITDHHTIQNGNDLLNMMETLELIQNQTSLFLFRG